MSLASRISSGESWFCMSLLAWELLGRCLPSALGHACIAYLSLNTAIFKRLTRSLSCLKADQKVLGEESYSG